MQSKMSFTFIFRAMVAGKSGPATSVDASPVVEAVCVKLEAAAPSPKKAAGEKRIKVEAGLGRVPSHQKPCHSP